MSKIALGETPSWIKRQIPEILRKKGEQIYLKNQFNFLDFFQHTYFARFNQASLQIETQIEARDNTSYANYYCSCSTFGRHNACQHVAALLEKIYSQNTAQDNATKTLYFDFTQSIWFTLSKCFFEMYGKSTTKIRSLVGEKPDKLELIYQDKNSQEILCFQVPESGQKWLVAKYGTKKDTVATLSFSNITWQMPQFSSSTGFRKKKQLDSYGYKTPLQNYLESFWHDWGKLWYLYFNDFTNLKLDFVPEQHQLNLINRQNGFCFKVPKKILSEILATIFNHTEVWKKISSIASPAQLDYKLEINPNQELEISPILVITSDEKQPQLISLTDNVITKQNVIGRFIYLPEFGFIPFKRKEFYLDPRYFTIQLEIIPSHQVFEFIQKYKFNLDNDQFYVVSSALKNKKVLRQVKAKQVHYSKFSSGWLYLSVNYGIGNETISFLDIYQNLKNGKNFIVGKDEWIDLGIEEFAWLAQLNEKNIVFEKDGSKSTAMIKLRSLDYMKFRATLPITQKSFITPKLEEKINQFESLKNIQAPPKMVKADITLRNYQETGYAWLWYLYKNGLSGLLCDDMGLGKTFQSLAVIAGIVQNLKAAKFLIVCPTSVLHHWKNKLALISGLNIILHYGPQRDVKKLDNTPYTAILTSYGILRNDIQVLKQKKFNLVIYDEIQLAKNKSSLTFFALTQLQANMKIGLTGTPIENYIQELRALFELILPGYLGSDAYFEKRFVARIEKKTGDTAAKNYLKKLIDPFILRRTKSQVLTELPPKIEEVRTCELSEDQIKFYRDIIDTQAGEIIQHLSKDAVSIPYMHIFAVLNYLKQVCNHPAQLENNNVNYQQYQSGKWDLFCELLNESLNSGLKVVIFSQYLNMLALIEKYLSDNNIHFATIKGSTQNRGEMIEKFNTDPECMVFTASLRAGGLGIDLTGGSVVIHYDRWWNAAREDQATDRVYRIGQTRGVQVFKLVTEGTLEEKIDQIIFRKKNLMEDIIGVDDAATLKKLNREEFLELLRLE